MVHKRLHMNTTVLKPCLCVSYGIRWIIDIFLKTRYFRRKHDIIPSNARVMYSRRNVMSSHSTSHSHGSSKSQQVYDVINSSALHQSQHQQQPQQLQCDIDMIRCQPQRIYKHVHKFARHQRDVSTCHCKRRPCSCKSVFQALALHPLEILTV